jgi:hypothetical protein
MSAAIARGLALLLAFGIASGASVRADAAGAAAARSACAPHAAEAAERSRLAEGVILRVMHVESRGRQQAISPKGAMGCMQIMPATWRYLTARHGLGSDPWDPRFNMIGGALYLAELARQFGFPGAYAAYNAGPARYARHVRKSVPLPAETVAYMASLSGTAPPRRFDPAQAATRAPRWQEAGLFTRAEPARADRGNAVASPEADAVRRAPRADDAVSPVAADGLFPLAGSRAARARADDDEKL